MTHVLRPLVLGMLGNMKFGWRSELGSSLKLLSRVLHDARARMSHVRPSVFDVVPAAKQHVGFS